MDTILLTCEHLRALEKDLRDAGIATQAEGCSWWGPSKGNWVFFNAFLDGDALRRHYRLPDFVTYNAYDGKVAGEEAGFECLRCESAIKGVLHPRVEYPTFSGPIPWRYG